MPLRFCRYAKIKHAKIIVQLCHFEILLETGPYAFWDFEISKATHSPISAKLYEEITGYSCSWQSAKL